MLTIKECNKHNDSQVEKKKKKKTEKEQFRFRRHTLVARFFKFEKFVRLENQSVYGVPKENVIEVNTVS